MTGREKLKYIAEELRATARKRLTDAQIEHDALLLLAEAVEKMHPNVVDHRHPPELDELFDDCRKAYLRMGAVFEGSK